MDYKGPFKAIPGELWTVRVTNKIKDERRYFLTAPDAEAALKQLREGGLVSADDNCDHPEEVEFILANPAPVTHFMWVPKIGGRKSAR